MKPFDVVASVRESSLSGLKFPSLLPYRNDPKNQSGISKAKSNLEVESHHAEYDMNAIPDPVHDKTSILANKLQGC